MNTHHPRALPGILAAAALALAASVGAQPPPASAPAADTPQAAPTSSRHKHAAGAVKPAAAMKAECEAMMAGKREMKDELDAMDATLDKLVADMNAAQGSKVVDALEKPMAAVINELVAQRKASRAMKAEMESEMMAHMMKHMEMAGTKAGKKSMADCPMMKMNGKAEPGKPRQM